jgi:hypothetical protein
MNGIGMTWARAVRRLGLTAACCLMGGCAGYEESGLPGSASSMAKNQMMLVRPDPPSFGFYRLTSLIGLYPDLGIFVEKQGMPDFLAETETDGTDYFILYYLKTRRAYACRTKPGEERMIEFAGPYPVTELEFKTLDGFRRQKDAQ